MLTGEPLSSRLTAGVAAIGVGVVAAAIAYTLDWHGVIYVAAAGAVIYGLGQVASEYRARSALRSLSKVVPADRREPGMTESRQTELRLALARRTADILDPEDQHGIERFRQALWLALLIVAVADDDLDHREVLAVYNIFTEITGHEFEQHLVLNAARDVARDRQGTLAEIARASADLDQPCKEVILEAALLVLLADRYIAPREEKLLTELARALRVPLSKAIVQLDRLTETGREERASCTE